MKDRKRTTKTGGGPPNRNRWKGLLATRQPDAVIEAFQRIAKNRNTTVSAMLGEAAVKIVADARRELPQKLRPVARHRIQRRARPHLCRDCCRAVHGQGTGRDGCQSVR
jgi:hypothetical protein